MDLSFEGRARVRVRARLASCPFLIPRARVWT